MSKNSKQNESDKIKSNNVTPAESFSIQTLRRVVESKDLGKLWNPLNWDFKEFICGWGSAFVNICVTYPINKVTFRQVRQLFLVFSFL